ncbi:MAG: hypothetical protein E6I73_13330 [Chloroflexi bacterium]|nr:MAG: hypothetical protein E6I73_13330 [Chloroflexota bacterium]
MSMFGRDRREERRRPQVEVNLLDGEATKSGLLARARRVWRLPVLGAGLVVAVAVALRLGNHL